MKEGVFTDNVLLAATGLGLSILLITQSILPACLGTLTVPLVVWGYQRGWWGMMSIALRKLVERMYRWLLVRQLPVREKDVLDLYDLVLGHDPLTREADIENLTELGHMGVYGVTRFGKTTWIHSVLHQLITTCRPRELRLTISDPKQTDYSFYSRLPHLLCPIARDTGETEKLIERLVAEMDWRITLFKPYAQTNICNNIYRYQDLSGERLPWILAIFDELTDVVKEKSQAEANLVRLSKLGLGYGIQLLCGTQRPSAAVMTGELQANVSSVFSTWMRSAREYGVVAQIPKEVYQDMQRRRGRFIVYSPKGWRFLQSAIVPDQELARRAASIAGRLRLWEWETEDIASIPPDKPRSWAQLSESEKMDRVRLWYEGLDKEPTLQEWEDQFGFVRNTAKKYRKLIKEGKASA